VASCWGDYDNDGYLDLFVASSSNDENLLYHNNGDETFSLVTTGSIATDVGSSHGCNWMDVDNDGDLDLFVTNDQAQRKFLYINDGTGVLNRNNNEVITSALSNSYGTCWSDYDRDGDLDLLMSTHGNEKDRFFTNNGNSNNWLVLKLVGTHSNVSAIGARVRTKCNGIWQIREVNSQSGFGGQNSLNIHFGLGDNATVDSIEIKWPSGYTQHQTGVSSNQYLVIQEENASVISGTVFFDENGDCIQNETETSLAGVTIHISPGGISTVTNANGVYSVRLPNGSYTITQEVGNYWTQNCNSTNTVIVTATNQTWTGNDFPNQALSQGVDLKIDIASSAQRKGFRNNVVITYANVGTENATADVLQVTWSVDCTPISASPEWDSKVNNVTYWNLSQIPIGSSGMISILDSVSVNATVSDSITISASITDNLNELNNSDNQTTISEEIVGAIDPNDMLVTPIGIGEEHMINKEQELTYIIRFQNVGNFPAQNIEVRNILPDGIDFNSFKLLSSSHSGNFTKKGNELHWDFPNIWLPDSTNSEPKSHGFITYSVLPLSNITRGKLIQNQAEITFDYESPLKTNVVFNTIVTLPHKNNKLIVYPNPGNSLVTIKLDQGYFWEGAYKYFKIEDATGRKMNCDFRISDGNVLLDIHMLKPGIYFVTYHTEIARYATKIIKE